MTNPTTPRRALIVDDDPAILTLLQMVLEDLGFEVITAADGVAGLQVALEVTPDLVVTDAMMPRMTGQEMVRRLRERVPSLPVVMITASDIRAGEFPVLRKPFDLTQLEVTVLGQVGSAS